MLPICSGRDVSGIHEDVNTSIRVPLVDYIHEFSGLGYTVWKLPGMSILR